MKALLLLAAASVLALAGCQGGPGTAMVRHDLAEDGGRWLSTRRLIRTEWTFHPDGRYDALHQEGEAAAQIRGKYRWDNGLLVIDPERDYLEVRSRDAEEANRIQDRLSKGYVLAITWDGKEKFTGKPTDGGEALVFVRSQG